MSRASRRRSLAGRLYDGVEWRKKHVQSALPANGGEMPEGGARLRARHCTLRRDI